MGVFVYVGNLGSVITEAMLQDAFRKAGTVRSALVMRSARNDRSRGFGFVEFDSQEEADAAMREMNGLELEGRLLRVAAVRERDRGARTQGLQSYGGFGGARRSTGARRKRR
jgi:RNA recognition motif-containing protein